MMTAETLVPPPSQLSGKLCTLNIAVLRCNFLDACMVAGNMDQVRQLQKLGCRLLSSSQKLCNIQARQTVIQVDKSAWLATADRKPGSKRATTL